MKNFKMIIVLLAIVFLATAAQAGDPAWYVRKPIVPRAPVMSFGYDKQADAYAQDLYNMQVNDYLRDTQRYNDEVFRVRKNALELDNLIKRGFDD